MDSHQVTPTTPRSEPQCSGCLILNGRPITPYCESRAFIKCPKCSYCVQLEAYNCNKDVIASLNTTAMEDDEDLPNVSLLLRRLRGERTDNPIIENTDNSNAFHRNNHAEEIVQNVLLGNINSHTAVVPVRNEKMVTPICESGLRSTHANNSQRPPFQMNDSTFITGRSVDLPPPCNSVITPSWKQYDTIFSEELNEIRQILTTVEEAIIRKIAKRRNYLVNQ